VRKQLKRILDAEIDPEGPRVLLGQTGALDAEGFRMQLMAFRKGLNEA
jgi:hypothetical protein